jgi:hypothetical protein
MVGSGNGGRLAAKTSSKELDEVTGYFAEQMRKRAAESDDKELLEWAGHIRLIVARANGEEVNISLSQHQMPEDAEVKIPDPRG